MCQSCPSARWFLVGTMLAATTAAACDGPQSALAPAGRDAELIAALFGTMAAGALVIWVAVIAIAVYAGRGRQADPRRAAAMLIIGGGAVFPTLTLAALLVYGLPTLPRLLAPGPEGALRIEVVGEQWWWRVHYVHADGRIVAAANEVRLPLGVRTNLRLWSADVIHSFWIPSLAGKMDMFPGRVTALAIEPTRTGVFRGACAEYCGTSHARMALEAVVLERAAFDAWLEREAAPAVAPSASLPIAGAEVFARSGCGGCHTIRGTGASGVIGPDLTHVGSRRTLGAGTLPNDTEAFVRWVSEPGRLKPGVHMPAFGMLPAGELRALAAYLESLQ